MGNQPSKSDIYKDLSAILPNVDVDCATDEETCRKQHAWGVFETAFDRDQFIQALVVVMSSNGSTDLSDMKFSLLFARRDKDRLIATVVAVQSGVVAAKLEPEMGGQTQIQAFKALRTDVENRLYRMLQTVPSGGGPAPVSASASAERGAVVDMPPSYGKVVGED